MTREELASKCYDIQVSLGQKQVPEFEALPQIGMMVNLSLHIRGLPIIEYDKLRLVASYYFSIPPLVFKDIVTKLADIEFVRLDTEGSTIKKVLPQVPYFENIYEKVGEYAEVQTSINEQEVLALKILSRLSNSPTEKNNLYTIGAESRIVTRSIQIGEEGGYIVNKRARGKDILISPVFFSENCELFTDLTAKAGAKNVQRILNLIKNAQGWPLSLIESSKQLGGEDLSSEDVALIKRLAQDGAVKPPSILTPHSGNTYFLFTPTPGASKMNPANKEIYERAMALIASVRQGQLLPKEHAIKWPDKILKALKRDGWLRPTSEAYHQYHQLAVMKVGRLEASAGGKYIFRINESEENERALDLAIQVLEDGTISKMETNEEARIALQKDQSYVESLIASSKLRESEKVDLSEADKDELDNLLIKGLMS